MSDKAKPSDDANDLRRGAMQSLDHLRRMGVSYLPVPNPEVASQIADRMLMDRQPPAIPAQPDGTVRDSKTTKSPASQPVVAAQPQATFIPGKTQGTYANKPLPVVERRASLDELKTQVESCTRCTELACTRKQTVFGEGDPQARVCFFGEAPGADEDRQGQPFVGRAGQLLTKIIEASKMRREDVYILNTIKCRPPENRNPLPEELANCRHYFESQLEIIQPEYIVCLGLFAAQSLLATKLSIGKMRGRFHHYLGSKVLVTYHPAYLLRNAKMKGATWQDMQMLMREMGTL